MKSSYNKTPLEYGDIFKILTNMYQPKTIVEFGLLEGYSLKCFAEAGELLEDKPEIYGYDIFDSFIGNHAHNSIAKGFEMYENVHIEYGDFYTKYNYIDRFDMIHIDIANDGDTYKFAIDNYYPKLNEGGIMIMEGGTNERDNVSWMKKYDKPSIVDCLFDYVMPKVGKYNVYIVNKFPSITLISK